MTTYLTPKPPVHQARRYDPNNQESSAASLEAWIFSEGNAQTVTATVDANGFTIETSAYPDTQTITGVVGDWILMVNQAVHPEKLDDGELLRRFIIN